MPSAVSLTLGLALRGLFPIQGAPGCWGEAGRQIGQEVEVEGASLEAPLLSPLSFENSSCQDCPGEVPHEALWGEGGRDRWTGQEYLLY